MQESEFWSGTNEVRIVLSVRVASEHIGILRASVADPGLDVIMGRGRFSDVLSETNLLLLEPGLSLLQSGMLSALEYFPVSVCSKAQVVFFWGGGDLCEFLLLVEHIWRWWELRWYFRAGIHFHLPLWTVRLLGFSWWHMKCRAAAASTGLFLTFHCWAASPVEMEGLELCSPPAPRLPGAGRVGAKPGGAAPKASRVPWTQGNSAGL